MNAFYLMHVLVHLYGSTFSLYNKHESALFSLKTNILMKVRDSNEDKHIFASIQHTTRCHQKRGKDK